MEVTETKGLKSQPTPIKLLETARQVGESVKTEYKPAEQGYLDLPAKKGELRVVEDIEDKIISSAQDLATQISSAQNLARMKGNLWDENRYVEEIPESSLRKLITTSGGPLKHGTRGPVENPNPLYIDKFYTKRLIPSLDAQEVSVGDESELNIHASRVRIEKAYSGGMLGSSRLEMGKTDLPGGGATTLVFLKMDRGDVLPFVDAYRMGQVR